MRYVDSMKTLRCVLWVVFAASTFTMGCGYRCGDDSEMERGLEVGKIDCTEVCALSAGESMKRVWHDYEPGVGVVSGSITLTEEDCKTCEQAAECVDVGSVSLDSGDTGS